jgi:3-hydroxyacyl-[acyl-carrier-protein] dehydratase
MPVEPLVDFASLDLSRVLYTKDDLYALLRQRGTFALLDGVHVMDHERGLVVAWKDVRADDWWAKDHIPGRPLLPGTLMVEASAQLGCFDFYKRTPGAEKDFVGFTAIDNTRFRGQVAPPCKLYFVGKLVRVRTSLFTYRMQGVVDGAIVFESDVTGMRL